MSFSILWVFQRNCISYKEISRDAYLKTWANKTKMHEPTRSTAHSLTAWGWRNTTDNTTHFIKTCLISVKGYLMFIYLLISDCNNHCSYKSGPVFDQSIHRTRFSSSCSHYQSEALSPLIGSGPDYTDICALCFTLPPCRNPTTGLQIDFLDRTRQNQCQLKFCCSCWFAWAVVSYLHQG